MIFSLRNRLKKLESEVGAQIDGIPLFDECETSPTFGKYFLSTKRGLILMEEAEAREHGIPVCSHIPFVERPRPQAQAPAVEAPR